MTTTPGKPDHPRVSGAAPCVLVLCGPDRPGLIAEIDALVAYLERSGDDAHLPDIAYTLSQSIAAEGERLAIVAPSIPDLRVRLDRARQRLSQEKCPQIKDVTGIYYFAEPLAFRGKLAFLFPGEGAQYLGMLDGLEHHFPGIKAIYEESDTGSAEYRHDSRPISRFTASPARLAEADRVQLERDLRQIDNAMFSVYMASWVLLDIVQQMGLKPDAVAGHSAGELAALVIAGVFDPETHLTPLGGAMRALVGQGDTDNALLAVGAPRDALAEVIATALEDAAAAHACVAMDNCPHQSIAVGDKSAIARVEGEAMRRGLMCERLDLGRPYHTRWFEPYMGPLRTLFAGVEFRTPQLPVYSCTTGELFPSSPDEIRELALSHWREPVEFTRLIRNLHRDGVRVFVEIGPRNNLTSFVGDILRGQEHAAVSSNVPHRDAMEQLCHMAAELIAHHVPLRLECLLERQSPRVVDWRQAGADAATGAAPEAVAVPTVSGVPAGAGRRRATAAHVVLQQHFAVAEQFLDVQTQVMQQFLRRRRSSRPATAARQVVPSTGGPVQRQAAHPQSTQPQQPPPVVGPMIGKVVELQPGKKLVVERVLDVQEDVYAAHHTVGGRSISKVDPDQHGLPIMPMTFTLELMMEAASAVCPKLAVLAVKNVRLSRWLAFYEDDPSTIQLTATMLEAAPEGEAPGACQLLVEVKDLGRASERQGGRSHVAAVGTVILGGGYPPAPRKGDFTLANERPCRTDVPTTYNNLFHGELLQGFESVERFGDDGIEGAVRTLPRRELFASIESPNFIGDPVLLDVAMHPAVAWHLEQEDQSGRIMLPFELKRLELYGPMPAEGMRFLSRTRIVEETHWHYTHVTEVFDDAGRLWGKIDRIKLWRFYLPFHDVNFHGPKDVYFLCDEWPAATPTGPASEDEPPVACCVRLRELNDLKQPALQLVGARVMLSPQELTHFLALERPDDKKAEWLFGRAAAKDAIRILQRKRHGERPFMADVEISTDEFGRPLAAPRGRERPADYPQASIAHAAGHIVAIAAAAPRVGIDIESIVQREAGFETIAFSADERRLLDRFEDRNEWIARFWCAKEAVGKALGRGLLGGPQGLAVCAADPATGRVLVKSGPAYAAEFPEFSDSLIAANTHRENELVVATTLCEMAPASMVADAAPLTAGEAS